MQLDIWLNNARLFGNVAIGACIISCIIIYFLEKNNKPNEPNVRFAFFGNLLGFGFVLLGVLDIINLFRYGFNPEIAISAFIASCLGMWLCIFAWIVPIKDGKFYLSCIVIGFLGAIEDNILMLFKVVSVFEIEPLLVIRWAVFLVGIAVFAAGWSKEKVFPGLAIIAVSYLLNAGIIYRHSIDVREITHANQIEAAAGQLVSTAGRLVSASEQVEAASNHLVLFNIQALRACEGYLGTNSPQVRNTFAGQIVTADKQARTAGEAHRAAVEQYYGVLEQYEDIQKKYPDVSIQYSNDIEKLTFARERALAARKYATSIRENAATAHELAKFATECAGTAHEQVLSTNKQRDDCLRKL